MRLTAACPEAFVGDANQLAMCLAFGPADGETYRVPGAWQDVAGQRYSAASWEAGEDWLAAAQSPLTRPGWDTAELIDLDAAARAQAAVLLMTEPRPATPGALTVMVGMPGTDALAAMGLVPVPLDME
jgi:hypothetical protein